MGWLFVLVSSTWLSVGGSLCKPGLTNGPLFDVIDQHGNCLIILVLSQCQALTDVLGRMFWKLKNKLYNILKHFGLWKIPSLES